MLHFGKILMIYYVILIIKITYMDSKLVLIPTYNEKENIENIIRVTLALDGNFSVLVIDDGSPDGTADIVKKIIPEFTSRLYILERVEKNGLGAAYIAGFKWALAYDYDYIFEMDADFSHNPNDLIKLYERATEGYDVVVGSRYVCGVNVVNWPFRRLLMSYMASKYVELITRVGIKDATAGFVCYKSSFLQSVNFDRIKMKGYGFQIEMKYTAKKLKFKISEVSIIFIDRTLGASKMNSSIFGEAFWGVLKLPFRKIKIKGE